MLEKIEKVLIMSFVAITMLSFFIGIASIFA